MWNMIFFTWAIPLALAGLAVWRIVNGMRITTMREQRFLFGRAPRGKLSLWFWTATFGLAIGFFALGAVEAVVLLNLGALWATLGAVFTGALAAASLILLLRSRFAYRTVSRSARGSAGRRRRIAYSPDF